MTRPIEPSLDPLQNFSETPQESGVDLQAENKVQSKVSETGLSHIALISPPSDEGTSEGSSRRKRKLESISKSEIARIEDENLLPVPEEIFDKVASFCDTQTLARLFQASLQTRRMVFPILFQCVWGVRPKQLYSETLRHIREVCNRFQPLYEAYQKDEIKLPKDLVDLYEEISKTPRSNQAGKLEWILNARDNLLFWKKMGYIIPSVDDFDLENAESYREITRAYNMFHMQKPYPTYPKKNPLRPHDVTKVAFFSLDGTSPDRSSPSFGILNLSNIGLTSIPKDLFSYCHYPLSLDLSDNYISNIPKNEELSDLQELNLRNNKLTSVSTSLGNLRQLRILDLSENQISSLPDVFEAFGQLKTLSISKNPMVSLPQSLLKLDCVKDNLDKEFSHLFEHTGETDTQENVSETRLHHMAFPDSLSRDEESNFPALFQSVMGNTQEEMYSLGLRYVMKIRDRFQPLYESFQKGEITLPREFIDLYEEISKNPKKDTAVKLEGLLDLRDNFLFWQKIGHLILYPDGSSFDIHHAKSCRELIEAYRNFSKPSLQLVGMTPFDSDRSVEKTRRLNLSNLGLTSIPKDLFSEPLILLSLDLSNNHIPEVPYKIGEMMNLESLNLDNNRLSSLPDSIGILFNLQKLNLSGNQISSLPDTFENFDHLEALSVSGNPLTSLPQSLLRHERFQDSLRLEFSHLFESPDEVCESDALI